MKVKIETLNERERELIQHALMAYPEDAAKGLKLPLTERTENCDILLCRYVNA